MIHIHLSVKTLALDDNSITFSDAEHFTSKLDVE